MIRALLAFLLMATSSWAAWDPVNPNPAWRTNAVAQEFGSQSAAGTYACTTGYNANSTLVGFVESGVACTSDTCPFNPSGSVYYRPTCHAPPSEPHTLSNYTVYQNPACASGFTPMNGECVAGTCINKINTVFDGTFGLGVAAAAENAYWVAQGTIGSYVCAGSPQGCRARMERVACTATAPEYADCSYTAKYTNPPLACEGTDRASGLQLNSRVVTSTEGGISGGGVGVNTNLGTASAVADTINLGKIATNTARIGDILAGQASGPGGGSGGGGSTCGGPSQPACSVTVNEGTTGDQANTLGAAILGTQQGMENQLQANVAALNNATAPSFLPGAGRWIFSMSDFLPAASCSIAGMTLPAGNLNVPVSLSVCNWASYAQDFLYWAFALFTAWSVWATIFAPRAAA